MQQVTKLQYQLFMKLCDGTYTTGVSGICEPPVFTAYDKDTNKLIARVRDYTSDPTSPVFLPSHPGPEYEIDEEKLFNEVCRVCGMTNDTIDFMTVNAGKSIWAALS